VDVSYYSIKQHRLVHELVRLERAAKGWADPEVGVDCEVAVIDRLRFDSWLVEDERIQKAKPAIPAVMVATAPASKSPHKTEPTKKRKGR